jgi:hypothetical protein
VGTDPKLISEGLNNKVRGFGEMSNLYGNGDSGSKIVDVITNIR